ncbi:MAG TPA: class II fructose-bisphosphate aldolase [Candidatus Limnocylindrales bacterium]|jgi:fructose/tagatose bisphosphate aldolase|nr:class II fructose-bisphosphate aldolase [Candidatus Limnocylindrales bacterium]
MPHPTPAASVADLLRELAGACHVEGDQLVIDDERAFRDAGVRVAAWSATFSDDAAAVEVARWIIWQASQQLGAPSWSIHELYLARGRGEVAGFTVPAVNIRTQVMDMAAAMCRAADAIDAGTIIFELARSEQEYTFQRPGEYITSVLAGCIAAGWQGPVFVQGDHYQFNAKKYAADPDSVTEGLRRLAREALEVGYGNIDIDSSTLVDLSLDSVDEQQRTNYQRAAELSALIRANEPAGMIVSIGGEIGEVGKQNSTEEELRAYLDGYRRSLDSLAGRETPGLSKVSVQTGTSHGGVPLAGGGVAEVKLDFGTLERLSAVCREYGMAGAVQHGASTLPDELFHRFPQVETAEIHLATGFQNLLYDHPAFPPDLKAEIEGWCFANTADERKEGESDDVFLYKTRKKALGPYKRQLWELPTKDEILADQEAKLRYLFEQLGIAGSKEMVARHVRAEGRSRPLPDALRAVSAGQGG